MAEREIVVDKLRLNYEGLFDVKEFYALIDNFFEEKNYDKKEIRNIESVKPEGKYIELELEPWKKYTDYYRNIIHMRIILSGIREVEVEKDKLKIKINQGKIQVIIDGIIETDYEGRWESKGIFFFIRTIWDKFIYRPYTLSYQASVRNDVNALHQQMKGFLNLYRY